MPFSRRTPSAMPEIRLVRTRQMDDAAATAGTEKRGVDVLARDRYVGTADPEGSDIDRPDRRNPCVLGAKDLVLEAPRAADMLRRNINTDDSAERPPNALIGVI